MTSVNIIIKLNRNINNIKYINNRNFKNIKYINNKNC